MSRTRPSIRLASAADAPVFGRLLHAFNELYESAGFTNREGGPEGPRMLYYERDL